MGSLSICQFRKNRLYPLKFWHQKTNLSKKIRGTCPGIRNQMQTKKRKKTNTKLNELQKKIIITIIISQKKINLERYLKNLKIIIKN